jgi:hypothetical protein
VGDEPPVRSGSGGLMPNTRALVAIANRILENIGATRICIDPSLRKTRALAKPFRLAIKIAAAPR